MLLLGEAVRLLVQSGAVGASITTFINEYSAVIESTLAPTAEPAQLDLKAQMKEAVIEAMHELVPVRPSKAGPRRQFAVYIAGAKTSLSLRRELVERTVAHVGSEKQARQLINELANAKPDSQTNRTAWVEEQLQLKLLLAQAESTFAQRTTH